jgi:hypothetical protein
VKCGMPVAVKFDDVAPGVGVPKFILENGALS